MADPHRFEFNLDRGIRDQVIERLKTSPLHCLADDDAPRASGIYALYHHERLVYVGKSSGFTKSKRTLRARLAEHKRKIAGRRHITLEEMQFRYLTFDSEWWVVAAELAMMETYTPEWNDSGFGSKVPGRGRPGTERISVWDQQFPPK